MAQGLCIVVMV
jgi:hypothetical protein